MEPDAHVDAELAGAVPDRQRAADRARRAVERGQEAVAGRLDLATRKPLELTANHGVVRVEQIAPASVPELAHEVGGMDDVAEHDGRQDAIGVDATHAREEFLDLGDDRIAVADVRQMLVAGKLRVARARDVLGEIPSVTDEDGAVALPVDDQRRRLDRGQHRA